MRLETETAPAVALAGRPALDNSSESRPSPQPVGGAAALVDRAVLSVGGRQAGCVSHNAYWRVKDHCKRTGKRCVFADTPSATSLQRALTDIGSDA